MRVYISGPVSGIADLNRPAFDAATAHIRAEGLEPVNPLDLVPYRPELTWLDYMRSDVAALMACDEVRVLPGWELSRGARIEVGLALDLGIPVRPAPGVGASASELRALDEEAP